MLILAGCRVGTNQLPLPSLTTNPVETEVTAVLSATISAPVFTPTVSLSLANNLNKIVFASANKIYMVDVTSQELTTLAHVDQEPLCCPRWSPDRQKIGFALGWGMYYGVYMVNADGSELKRLTYIRRYDGESPPLVPAWSADSQQIDFVYGPYSVVSEDASPDGQRIAYVVTRSENDQMVADLYLKRADGTGVTKLTTTPFSSISGIDW